MSGIRGRWGRWKIRWGVIRRKCGVQSGCWGNEATEDGSWMGLSGQRRHWIISYHRLHRLDDIVLYRLDCIVLSAGLYRIVWIGSYRIVWIRKHCLLCAGWLLDGWDGWDGWTRMDVSTHRNLSFTMGSRTGAPPLALEGRQAMGSGGWHQFCWWCKDTEYLCRRSKKKKSAHELKLTHITR